MSDHDLFFVALRNDNQKYKNKTHVVVFKLNKSCELQIKTIWRQHGFI